MLLQEFNQSLDHRSREPSLCKILMALLYDLTEWLLVITIYPVK